MSDIEIMTWSMGGGFAGTWAMMFYMMSQTNKRVEDLSCEIKYLRLEMKDLREDVQDIDRRLCRIEGSLSSKDCCMLKEDGQRRKAN